MRRVYVLNGWGNGQETKGKFAAALTRLISATEMLRYGGCNGSHYVRSGGLSHSFCHFGSGSFSGANTTLVNMVMDPFLLFQEAETLEKLGLATNMFERIRIHEDCLVITPYHGAISRFREHVRDLTSSKKGTIGLGVGEAVTDSTTNSDLTIKASELGDKRILRIKIEKIRESKRHIALGLIHQWGLEELPFEARMNYGMLDKTDMIETIVDAMYNIGQMVCIIDNRQLTQLVRSTDKLVVEGSHGVLLHPWYGFAPHTTQLDPTGASLVQNLHRLYKPEQVVRLAVLRSYMHRHGAGPLVTQDDVFGDMIYPDRNDGTTDWLGPFRMGPIDFVALRYAFACVGGTQQFQGLLMSHLDDLNGRDCWPFCDGYIYTGVATDLDEYFVHQNGRISAIRVHPDTRDEEHRSYQVRLTQLLYECQPRVSYIEPKAAQPLVDAFVERVGFELGLPVVIRGTGPDARDYTIVPGYEHLFVP